MAIIISGLQNRVKNSAAYAEELGIMLIANGEELPYVLTAQGEQIRAGIDEPATPTAADGGGGTLTNGQWVCYKVVYVSENTFPSVAAVIYSNPSERITFQIGVTGGVFALTRQIDVDILAVDNSFVTHAYLYRTTLQASQTLAETAADAGLMYYIGKVANTLTGTITVTDNTLTNVANDPIELTNFVSQQFRFVIWDGSYFWGFANHPFSAEATWDTDGTFSLVNTSTDKFYGGRNNQFITFQTISTGGIDGRGTFLFEQTGDFTGKVIDENGADLTLPSSGTGNIVIVGATANLYRSAYRNPFSWGYSASIGGVYIPSIWELKVSGSLGTAIAIVPDQQLLKLDMEFPALCVTFSLQTSGTDVFNNTRRQVSKLYSVTSHFSQFVAVSKGKQVLWGMDYKNLAIVESDGFTQVPVSGPISIILRKLSANRSLHLLTHGIYDPETEINAIWLSSQNADSDGIPSIYDLCVYQHSPTGFWGIIEDYGITASASVENLVTSKRNVYVGTENGFLGKAFDPSTYGNWLPSNSIFQGYINAATFDTITRSDGQDDFDPLANGLVGNYVLCCDPSGFNIQIRKIVAATFNTLTVEPNFEVIPTITENPGLVDGQWQFFIGLIELRVLKYFDGGEPSQDKAPREYWGTLKSGSFPTVEFYPEHSETPSDSVVLAQDGEGTLDAWYQKLDFATKKQKTFGLALTEKSFEPTEFFNFTLK